MVARISQKRPRKLVIEFSNPQMINKESCRMIMRKGTAFWAILFALTFSLSALGQGRRNAQQQQQQQQQAQPQPQGVGPVYQSKDESDAFNNLQKEQDPAKKIELAEAFVAKYPNSD